ncbi:MAG: hypothetical protein LHV68_05140 [Elusimicrobia bacterium]|nr:hypothetical protein [Candidatus Liberimonas magnetica]
MSMIRENLDAIEKYVYAKYFEVLKIPEEPDTPIGSKKVERIYDLLQDGLSIKSLTTKANRLNIQEKIILSAELKLFVANSVGDLQETYRYESVEEGELYERYLDDVLVLAESLIEKEVPEYSREQYMQVAE